MAKGRSLHIGVNKCSADHYAGWEGPLQFCEADADSVHEIAVSRDFEANVLMTEAATRDAVRGGIKHAAGALSAGDIFLLTYAGHGGQIRDIN